MNNKSNMFIVTKSGLKLPVDDSGVDWDNDFIPFQDNVGVYTDDTILKDIWILQLQKKSSCHGSLNIMGTELEMVKELEYDHEPTKEEILWAMSAYGVGRWGIVTVIKGYELDINYDD